MENENKLNVKVGDVVKVNSGYSFDPAIGMVVASRGNWKDVKITSAQNDDYKYHSCTWAYCFSEIIEIISRAEEPKPQDDKQLTPRQRATYELIKSNSEQGRMTSQKEIYANFAYDKETNPKGYRWNDSESVHDHCISVWFDINTINLSPKIEKIIISDNNYNYKLAESFEEVEAFAKALYYDMAMAKLVRYGNLLRKARLNGQGKLLSVNNVPIDKQSKARPFVEAFVPKLVDDLVAKMESEDK